MIPEKETHGLTRKLLSILSVALLFAGSFKEIPVLFPLVGFLCLVSRICLRKKTTTARPARAALQNAVLSLVSISLSLLAVELTVRHFFVDIVKHPSIYMHHPDHIFALRPNSAGAHTITSNSRLPHTVKVSISNQGLRDREYGPKRPDEFRILVLGDSYTMGHGLTPGETYPKVLELLLNAKNASPRITVINAGASGYSPWQERGMLVERGLPLNPDLVILQLFPANDIAGCYARENARLNAIHPDWERRLELYRRYAELPARIEIAAQQHFTTYAHLATLGSGNPPLYNFLASLRLFPKSTRINIVPLSNRQPEREACLDSWYPDLEKAWKCFVDDLAGIKSICDEKNIPLIAFCHPDSMSIQDSFWSALNDGRDVNRYIPHKDIDETEKALYRLDIRFIRMGARMAMKSPMTPLFYTYDGHFSPKGAHVVAQVLAEVIEKDFLAGK